MYHTRVILGQVFRKLGSKYCYKNVTKRRIKIFIVVYFGNNQIFNKFYKLELEQVFRIFNIKQREDDVCFLLFYHQKNYFRLKTEYDLEESIKM